VPGSAPPRPFPRPYPANMPGRPSILLFGQLIPERALTEASPSLLATPSAQGERLRLFVDCVPNLPTAPLSDYVAKVAAQVSEAGGVEDLRFAGSESALGFGRWKGAFAMAIRNAPPAPGTYAALGIAHSELLQLAIEALEPMCGPGDFVRAAR